LDSLDNGPPRLKHVADWLKTMTVLSQNDTFWCFLTYVLFTYFNFGTKPFLKVTAKYVARAPVILQNYETAITGYRQLSQKKIKVNRKLHLQQFGQGV